MATFLRCPYCRRVQRDIMGETIWTNDEGDILDLDGKPANAIEFRSGWMPIKCNHCGLVAREEDWIPATRKEWGVPNRFITWLTVQWDRFVEVFKSRH